MIISIINWKQLRTSEIIICVEEYSTKLSAHGIHQVHWIFTSKLQKIVFEFQRMGCAKHLQRNQIRFFLPLSVFMLLSFLRNLWVTLFLAHPTQFVKLYSGRGTFRWIMNNPRPCLDIYKTVKTYFIIKGNG